MYLPTARENEPLDDRGIFTILRLIGFILAITGNSFVVFLIVKTKTIRKERFNLFILLLAFGDIVIGLGHLARVITQQILHDHYTKFTCLMSGSLIVYGGHLAQLAMLLIAADRLYGIWHLHTVQVQRFNTVCLLTIPISLFICLIPAAAIFLGVENGPARTCQVGSNWNAHFGHYMFGHMVVNNVTIIGLYILIIVLYYKKLGKLSGSGRNNFIAIIIGVAVVYVCCWMAPKILSFSLKGIDDFRDGTQLTAALCELLSAVLNIFVYGFAHKDIRKALKTFFTRTQVTVATASILTGY